MTLAEFQHHYKELADAFGQQAFNAKRGVMLFRYVEDLPREWWARTVEHMIITNNQKFAIAEWAQSERKAMNSARRAREESEAAENLLRNASQSGNENAMKLFSMFKSKNHKGA